MNYSASGSFLSTIDNQTCNEYKLVLLSTLGLPWLWFSGCVLLGSLSRILAVLFLTTGSGFASLRLMFKASSGNQVYTGIYIHVVIIDQVVMQK